MRRVAVLYDGFNFYYGLRKLKQRTGVCLYWQDLIALSGSLMAARRDHHPGDHVCAIGYFTAHIRTFDRPKEGRQKNYLNLLETYRDSGLFVKKGLYQLKDIRCPHCDAEPAPCGNCSQQMVKAQEKQTDVNIALWALIGAFRDAYDDLILVTSDSDLAPAAEQVRRHFGSAGKRVYFAFPPEQVRNRLLIDHCDDWVEVTEDLLQACLHRRIVHRPERRYSCPAEWQVGGAVR